MVKAASMPWRAIRVVVLAACAIALTTSFVVVLRQSSDAISADADVVAAERQGVIYLHPLTGLIGELVKAQSAAVRGQKFDPTNLRAAVEAVGRADGNVGMDLGTHQRFLDLSDKINGVLGAGLTGRPAYQAYSDVMVLVIDLGQRVGDSSNLIHDPDLDSYYLMKAALEQLPTAMISAARAADLVALSGTTGKLGGESAVQVAVARYGVAQAAEQVSAGLNKSVDATARDELGASITPRLDAFRTAAEAFAPATMLAEFANAVDGRVLAAAAQEVFDTGLMLDHKLLTELDNVLTMRQRALEDQRKSTVWAIVATALVVLVLFWTVVLGRRRKGGDQHSSGRSVDRAEGINLSSLGDLRRLLDDDLVGAGSRDRARGRGRGDAR